MHFQSCFCQKSNCLLFLALSSNLLLKWNLWSLFIAAHRCLQLKITFHLSFPVLLLFTSWENLSGLYNSLLLGCWKLVPVIQSYWRFQVKFGPFELCKRRNFIAQCLACPPLAPCLPACLLLILQPVPNPHHSPYHPPSANHPRNPRGNKTFRFFQHCCCSSLCSIAYPGCVFLAPPGALIVRLFRDNILSRRKGLSVPNCPKWSWQILAGQWEVMRRLWEVVRGVSILKKEILKLSMSENSLNFGRP